MSYPFTLDDCRKEAARMAAIYGVECTVELSANSTGDQNVWVRIGGLNDAHQGYAMAPIERLEEAERCALAYRREKAERTIREVSREAAALGFRLEPQTEASR